MNNEIFSLYVRTVHEDFAKMIKIFATNDFFLLLLFLWAFLCGLICTHDNEIDLLYPSCNSQMVLDTDTFSQVHKKIASNSQLRPSLKKEMHELAVLTKLLQQQQQQATNSLKCSSKGNEAPVDSQASIFSQMEMLPSVNPPPSQILPEIKCPSVSTPVNQKAPDPYLNYSSEKLIPKERVVSPPFVCGNNISKPEPVTVSISSLKVSNLPKLNIAPLSANSSLNVNSTIQPTLKAPKKEILQAFLGSIGRNSAIDTDRTGQCDCSFINPGALTRPLLHSFRNSVDFLGKYFLVLPGLALLSLYHYFHRHPLALVAFLLIAVHLLFGMKFVLALLWKFFVFPFFNISHVFSSVVNVISCFFSNVYNHGILFAIKNLISQIRTFFSNVYRSSNSFSFSTIPSIIVSWFKPSKPCTSPPPKVPSLYRNSTKINAFKSDNSRITGPLAPTLKIKVPVNSYPYPLDNLDRCPSSPALSYSLPLNDYYSAPDYVQTPPLNFDYKDGNDVSVPSPIMNSIEGTGPYQL